jgi:hypothetical protein
METVKQEILFLRCLEFLTNTWGGRESKRYFASGLGYLWSRRLKANVSGSSGHQAFTVKCVVTKQNKKGVENVDKNTDFYTQRNL